MTSNDTSATAAAGPALSEGLGPLPEPAWFAPQWITEDAYSAAQMLHEKRVGSAEAMADACNELSAALGWPLGISHGALPWLELLERVARLRVGAAQMLDERLGDVAGNRVRAKRLDTAPTEGG